MVNSLILRCPEPGQLVALHEGSISEDDAAVLRLHLSRCGSCRERFAAVHPEDAFTTASAVSGLQNSGDFETAAPTQSLSKTDFGTPDVIGRLDFQLTQQALFADATTTGTGPQDATVNADSPATGARTATDDSTAYAAVKIGPYRLLSKLGRGGMGTVYKAQHEHLDKTVAIKVLLHERTRHQESVARFKHEMKAVGKLNHPNIVQAFDGGEIAGAYYLAMEFVSGKDLHWRVQRRGPLSVAHACRIIRQVAQALAAAHHAGLVHRDIKPANLLLAKTGQVKLLDLGLALFGSEINSHQDAGDPDQIFGTPDYMAPEQWSYPYSADARSDLYALGCTLFYLLIGRAPFATEQHSTSAGKMLAHVTEPIPDLQAVRGDVPDAVADIYRKLLAKEASQRYQTANEVSLALRQIASHTLRAPQ